MREDIAGNIFDYSFPFDLIFSRHKILKTSILNHQEELEVSLVEKLIKSLDELIDLWEIIFNLMIKYGTSKDFEIRRKIAVLINENILPATERFIGYLS